MEQLWIPAGEGNSEYIEKKSRFLGLVLPVTTEAEARAQLEAVKKREYDARHNCWAYVLHTGQKRYSDDGEPQGTAGQPMLAVFQREHVTNVLCVVTRYFGGVLLGASGLVRAYSHGASIAVEAAGVLKVIKCTSVKIEIPYKLYDRVAKYMDEAGFVQESADFAAGIVIKAKGDIYYFALDSERRINLDRRGKEGVNQ